MHTVPEYTYNVFHKNTYTNQKYVDFGAKTIIVLCLCQLYIGTIISGFQMQVNYVPIQTNICIYFNSHANGHIFFCQPMM